MASNTPNLNLLKKDPVVDGNDTFNIETMLNENWDKIDTGVGNKVDKVAGKQLSDTNYTIDEKMKLENVEVGANKTTIADNLTTNDSAKVLSAKQGFTLNVIIGSLSSLTTAIKTSIVNAINSLKTEVDEHKADSVSAHGVNLKANKTQEAWIIPTFQNGWQQGYLARYRKNEFGTLELRGTIASGTTTGGTVIFTLPLGYRPSVLQILTVSSYDGGLVSKNTMLLINTNGEVSIYGEASKTSITMNGTVFL